MAQYIKTCTAVSGLQCSKRWLSNTTFQCRVCKPNDKVHVVWVTTEGGDIDNTVLKPYEEALQRAKVVPQCHLLHTSLCIAMLCCAVLCCAVLCCGILGWHCNIRNATTVPSATCCTGLQYVILNCMHVKQVMAVQKMYAAGYKTSCYHRAIQQRDTIACTCLLLCLHRIATLQVRLAGSHTKLQ